MTMTILFWLQVVMACAVVIPQSFTIVEGKTKGLSLVFFSILIVYAVFSLVLAISSYKANRTKDRRQTLIIFIQWTVFWSVLFVLGLGKIPWTDNDTMICIVFAILIYVSVSYFSLNYGIKDPFVKASINSLCKAVPHLYLAYVVCEAKSSEGLPLITLVAGHLTSIPRVTQVFMSGYKGGWDRSTKALLIGEIVNVSTWCVFTVFWIYFRS